MKIKVGDPLWTKVKIIDVNGQVLMGVKEFDIHTKKALMFSQTISEESRTEGYVKAFLRERYLFNCRIFLKEVNIEIKTGQDIYFWENFYKRKKLYE